LHERFFCILQLPHLQLDELRKRIIRWRRLARDYEGLPQSSEAFIMLSACWRMLSLLAPPFP